MDKTIEEKLLEVAENVPKVYESGVREGKKTEHNEFWDSYLTSFHAGQGVDMHWFFAGSGWNDKTFYPTRDIKPRNAYHMFRYNLITDIWGRMEELGLTLDFSNTMTFYQTFWGYKGTWHGVIDMRKATATNDSCFRDNTNLVEIKKLILSEDTSLHNNMFTGCAELISMPIEGTIGKNSFNVSPCVKLNKASIESIINALSTKKSGLTVTLSQTAVDNAFETVKGAADGSTSAEWIALAGDENTEGLRPNWNISLV